LRKFGEFILKNRIILVTAIIIISVLFFIYLPELKMEDNERTWFSKEDPTLKNYDELKKTFIGAEFAVVAYKSDNPFSESEITYLSRLSRELKKVPYINNVISLTTADDITGTSEGLEIKPLVGRTPLSAEEISQLKQRINLNPFFKGNLISDDAGTVGIALSFEIPDKKRTGDYSQKITESIKDILSKEHKRTGRKFYLGGGPTTDAELGIIMEKDMSKFFPLSMLIVAVMLFLIFRRLPHILFPLITVLLALVWTLGLKGMLHSPITPVSTTLLALILVIGIADSIHIISYYGLSLNRIGDRKKAILETYQRVGKPCLFTSITTAVGFSSLSFSSIPAIRNLGISAGFGIMSAFILSMILVPLGMLLSKTRPETKAKEEHRLIQNMLKRTGEFNLKYPGPILIVSILVILVMGAGIPRIYVEGSLREYVKKNTPLRKGAEFMDKKLGGTSSTEVIIRGKPDDFENPATLKKIENLQKLVKDSPGVTGSFSMVDYIKLINRALHDNDKRYFDIPAKRETIAQSLLLYEMSGGEGIGHYVTINYDTARISVRTKQTSTKERKALLDKIKRYTDKNFNDFTVKITGWNVLLDKVTSRIVLTQIKSLGSAFLVILGLMMLLFGFKGGLVSMLPNIFPIVFVLGLMGWAGFHLDVGTAIVASIAIGIVVDDTIHFFSHFRQEFNITGNRELAMKNALRNVGGAICFTSLMIVAGFSVFLLSEMSILAAFGILSIVAIITALLGDLFIGPVLLTRFNVFKKREKKINTLIKLRRQHHDID